MVTERIDREVFEGHAGQPATLYWVRVSAARLRVGAFYVNRKQRDYSAEYRRGKRNGSPAWAIRPAV